MSSPMQLALDVSSDPSAYRGCDPAAKHGFAATKFATLDDDHAASVNDTGSDERKPQGQHVGDSRQSYCDSEDDRKPAAKPTQTDTTKNCVRDDDSSSSSGERSDDEAKPLTVTEDGRPLSDYELQRLERIKRNREYLARLGLEGDGVLERKKKRAGRRKKDPSSSQSKDAVTSRRSSMSRRTKMKPVSYAEPSASVRDLLRIVDGKIAPTADKTTVLAVNVASASGNDDIPPDVSDLPIGVVGTTVERKSKGKHLNERLEHFIYSEFKRIRGSKNFIVKTAERNLRAAEKEVKYWNKLLTVWVRRNERRKESDRQRLYYSRQREILGGKSTKELLFEIDDRVPTILQAIQRYDDSLQADQRVHEKEMKRAELENKLKMIDALDWFPEALENAVSLLNTAFVECAPDDPPAPRRSKRSSMDDDQNEPPTRKKKPLSARNECRPKSPVVDFDRRVGILRSMADSSIEDIDAMNEKFTDAAPENLVMRNVGGWISPEFASMIDRSWLERDGPTEKFDLSTYAPQVGDTVLYYMSGHRRFLDVYPDELGMKIGDASRIPLWETAAQLNDGNEYSERRAKSWWTPEWLEGVESADLGDYPLLCRVEQAHAEFPPDPFCKVVKKDVNHDGTKIFFKKPKGFVSVKGLGKVHLRLAVTLKPLTPVVAPHWCAAGPAEHSSLELPPTFTVVTFPCEVESFMVPFAWGYALAHSLALNQKVSIRSEEGTTVRIDGFTSLYGHDTMRLECRITAIERALARFDAVPTEYAALERELEELQLDIRDACVVLDVWYRNGRRLSKLGTAILPSEESTGFVDLLRSTLPLWRSVSVMRNMYDRKKQRLSPWCLVPAGKGREFLSPWSFGDYTFRLQESLRVKVECLIEDFAAENTVARDMFYERVTEDAAPSYFCAVPVGSALVNIVRRLQRKGKMDACYYRSCGSIFADVALILDCCLLYNSPDSDVVVESAAVVSSAKVKIIEVVQDHYRMKKTRKLDFNKRMFARRYYQTQVSPFDSLRKPFKESMRRDWLFQTHPESDRSSTVQHTINPDTRAFQAGDLVIYSRHLHDRFVKGHSACLKFEQSLVPSLDSASTRESKSEGCEYPETNDWVRGQIIWTSASFPKSFSKQGGHDVNSFQSMAVLQCLGIKFRQSCDMQVLYWRPCLFPFDASFAASSCSGCGLPHSSFIQLDDTASQVTLDDESKVCEPNCAISTCMRQSMDRCINLLKRRCLRAMHPAYVDPLLSNDNVRSGLKPPTTKIGKSSLPNFDRLLSATSDQKVGDNTPQHGTRGISLKPKEDDVDVTLLVEAGFLPLWVSSVSGGTADADLLTHFGAILATPKLSLELVQIRLRNCIYRHKAAVENDLVEAFLSTAVALVSEAASRKRSPVSVVTIALALASIPENSDGIPLVSELESINEETAWVQRLRHIRALYAAALVSVTNVFHAERVFGLAQYPTPKPIEGTIQDKDPFRVAARQKLSYLVSSLARDECLNTFGGDVNDDSLPLITLTIRYCGNLASFAGGLPKACAAPLFATHRDDVKVNIVCNGRPVIFKEILLSPPHGKLGIDVEGNCVAPPIIFGPAEYERNDALARLFFRRPGRAGACARCQVYKRSMLACRVLRRHSNLDFDWLSVVNGGVSNVDDLVKLLDPELVGKQDSSTEGETLEADQLKASIEEKVADCEVPVDGCESVGDNALDPREYVKKAASVLEVSKKVFEEAKSFSETPARLSKDFMKVAFPIDPSDGHYLYCVVCGLSGDLLCCDGCPNVVHSHCVALPYLPDGDWYCEECASLSASGAANVALNGDACTLSSIRAGTVYPAECGDERLNRITKNGTHNQPFGRVEFDFGTVELVSVQLDNLRNARPTQKIKRASIAGNLVDDGVDDDAMSVFSEDNDSPEDASLKKTQKKSNWGEASDEHHGDKPSLLNIKQSLEPRGGADRNVSAIENRRKKSAGGSNARSNSNPGSRKRRHKSDNTTNADPSHGSPRKRRHPLADQRIVDAHRTLRSSGIKRHALSHDRAISAAGRRIPNVPRTTAGDADKESTSSRNGLKLSCRNVSDDAIQQSASRAGKRARDIQKSSAAARNCVPLI